MRAVLDTNVLVRMVFSRRPDSVAGALFDLLSGRRFELVISEPLLEELSATLLSPHLVARHGWAVSRVERYVALMRVHAAIVTPGTMVVHVPVLERRDPDDLALIRAAMEGNADCIVSQDADLLDLDQGGTVQILDPLAFLRRLRAEMKTEEDQE